MLLAAADLAGHLLSAGGRCTGEESGKMNRRFGLLATGGLAAVLVAGGGTALAASMGPVGSA